MASTAHLTMLQTIIGRLAGHSFLAKGWSVTLASAVIGLAAKDGRPGLLLAGGLPVIMFWLVDAYYLALERGFRGLFVQAAERAQRDEPETFDMRVILTPSDVVRAGLRPAAMMVHLPLALVLVVVLILLT